MPMWPFKRRRTGATKETEPLVNKFDAAEKHDAHSSLPQRIPASKTTAKPVTSTATQSQTKPDPHVSDLNDLIHPKSQPENEVVPRGRAERDMTALPGRARLEQSPHLRPVNGARPAQIPYNFLNRSASYVSMRGNDSTSGKSSKNRILRTQTSVQDTHSGFLQRHRSGRRNRTDPVREEEIRAMSATIPIPKRPGDGPLRRDSKKVRGLTQRASMVSLPPNGSIHSSMSGDVAQRGWEVGLLDMLNPRPKVRLSGTLQGVTSTGIQPTPPSPIMEEPLRSKGKKKKRAGKTVKKEKAIGEQADDFDAGDLRLCLERDKTRRERHRKGQQEELESKLRSEAAKRTPVRSRSGNDNTISRPTSSSKRISEHRPLLMGLGNPAPPTAIHPAFRPSSSVEPDLERQPVSRAQSQRTTRTMDRNQVNPFDDADSIEGDLSPAALTPLETPLDDAYLDPSMDEPVYGTARAVRLSQAHTPPLSPNMYGSIRARAVMSEVAASDISETASGSTDRRISDARPSRTGAWASFFRRNNQTRPGDISPSNASFSNTSRESMRHMPLPAHLVDLASAQSLRRTSSGVPVRTLSKFREDLPGTPLSPPASRAQSPEESRPTTAIAGLQEVTLSKHPRTRDDIQDDENDNVMASLENLNHSQRLSTGAQSARKETILANSRSLASIGSEGSWLASGSIKRKSNNTVSSHTHGSLRRRNEEFIASYEDLDRDDDAEYVTGTHTPEGDGESRIPRSIEQSMMRRSRRDEFTEDMAESHEDASSEVDTPDFDDLDSPDSFELNRSYFDESGSTHLQLQKATSINVSRGHAKRVSAGSARMLDIMKPMSPRNATFEEQSVSPTTSKLRTS